MKLNTIDYGENWIWPDEFDWSPVVQTAEHTVTGALVIEESTKQAGRPITITGDWLTRQQLDAIKAIRDAGGAVTLLWRTTTRQVYWRHNETPIEARQVFDTSNPAAGDSYAVTLRFIEG